MSRPIPLLRKKKKLARREALREEARIGYAELLAWMDGFPQLHGLKGDFDLAGLLFGLANQLLAEEDPRSTEVVQKLTEYCPGDPLTLLAQGQAQQAAGEPARSIQTFNLFLVRWPLHRLRDEVRQRRDAACALLHSLGIEIEDPELASRREQILACLTKGRWDEAERLVERLLNLWPQDIPTRNNLSLIRYRQERQDEALSLARGVLKEDPGNVHAWGNLIRFLLASGQVDQARDAGERLLGVAPEGDPLKLAESFALLGEDERVVLTVESLPEEDTRDPALQHFYAAALARQGRWDEARSHWGQAAGSRQPLDEIRENLDNAAGPLGERHAAWAFSIDHWVSRHWLEKLMEIATTNLGSVLDRWPHLVKLIPIWLDRGDPRLTKLALGLALGDRRLRLHRELHEFGLGSGGTDSQRMRALTALFEANMIGPKVTMMWEGKSKDLALMGFKVTWTPEDPLEGPVLNLAQEAADLVRGGHHALAERKLHEALGVQPDHPVLLHFLACVVEGQGRVGEAEELRWRNHEVNTDHFFARSGMAWELIGQGDLERAELVLEPLERRRCLHVGEFAWLCQVQLALEAARGRQDELWTGLWESFERQDHRARPYRPPALTPGWSQLRRESGRLVSWSP